MNQSIIDCINNYNDAIKDYELIAKDAQKKLLAAKNTRDTILLIAEKYPDLRNHGRYDLLTSKKVNENIQFISVEQPGWIDEPLYAYFYNEEINPANPDLKVRIYSDSFRIKLANNDGDFGEDELTEINWQENVLDYFSQEVVERTKAQLKLFLEQRKDLRWMNYHG